MSQEIRPIDVTPSQLAATIDACFAADLPLMIWGDGGLGKSRIAEQRAIAASRVPHDVRLLIMDLPDLQGLPVLGAMAEGLPCPLTAPSGLPASSSPAPIALILEELPGASRMVQSAAYGLVLERRLNSYSLPADCRIIATGNLTTSGGVVNPMPRPLANRFMHVNLVCTPSEHYQYALSAGWHPIVTGYHAMTAGTEWSSFDVKSKEENYASPRSWEMVSKLLQSGGLAADIITPAMAGLLGYGVGAKFGAFVSLYATLAPTLSEMVPCPATCPLPTDAASRWFLAACVAGQWSVADDWCIKFLTRLPDELVVFAVNAAVTRDPQLARTPEFKVFAANPRYAALSRFI